MVDANEFQKLHEQDRVYKAKSTQGFRGLVLSFHGGCFTGGNTSWDVKQNMMLAELGFEVHQLAFPKTYKAFKAWACKFCWDALPQTKKVVCLGRSSGGYLACVFAALHPSRVSQLVLLCPVLDPEMRASLLPKFQKKTKAFFGLDVAKPIELDALVHETTCKSKKPRLLLFLAHNDGNVPIEVYSSCLRKLAIFPGPRTHQGVLGCTSSTLQLAIQEFVV